MLNKAKHKTRLTQNLKAKHTSNAQTKTRTEKEKSDRITWSPFFFHTLEEPFLLLNP